MGNYITSIHINRIFHLENLNISLSSGKRQHLLLTGKNGSGKTSLMNAVMEFVENVYKDKSLHFQNYDDSKVNVSFADITKLAKDIDEGRFIVAYYTDRRWPRFVEHDQPRKPDMMMTDIKTSKVDQFLDLLTHYQLQTAFAQLKDDEKRVSSIGRWFAGIEKIFCTDFKAAVIKEIHKVRKYFGNGINRLIEHSFDKSAD